MCSASEDERSFRLGYAERRYITGELQSLSTQLYYMLVMMLSDQAQEIVRTLLKVLVQKCGASYFGNTNLEWVSDMEQCCNLC